MGASRFRYAPYSILQCTVYKDRLDCAYTHIIYLLVFEFSHILFSLFKDCEGARGFNYWLSTNVLVYRKRKNSLNSLSHVNTPSLHWPEANFVQVRFIDPQSQPSRMPLPGMHKALKTKMFSPVRHEVKSVRWSKNPTRYVSPKPCCRSRAYVKTTYSI